MTKRYRNLMGQSIMDIPVYFKLCKESIYQRTILQSPSEGSHEIYRVSDEIKCEPKSGFVSSDNIDHHITSYFISCAKHLLPSLY